MSSSDSDLKISDFSSSDDDSDYSVDFYDNLIFYLICQEPSIFKVDRLFTGKKNRSCPLTLNLK